jgi:dolichyl-phosphate-mannose-protein mannosyltransferase
LTSLPPTSDAVPSLPVANIDQNQKPLQPEPVISQAAVPPELKVLSKEEKIEYRDQDGNLLDEEQVKALEGKVEFETKYATKTRVVDEQGREIAMPEGGWPNDLVGGVAPPHPDVEGVDKETAKAESVEVPKDAAASRDGEKEAEQLKAKPASEGQEATIQEEL